MWALKFHVIALFNSNLFRSTTNFEYFVYFFNTRTGHIWIEVFGNHPNGDTILLPFDIPSAGILLLIRLKTRVRFPCTNKKKCLLSLCGCCSSKTIIHQQKRQYEDTLWNNITNMRRTTALLLISLFCSPIMTRCYVNIERKKHEELWTISLKCIFQARCMGESERETE